MSCYTGGVLKLITILKYIAMGIFVFSVFKILIFKKQDLDIQLQPAFEPVVELKEPVIEQEGVASVIPLTLSIDRIGVIEAPIELVGISEGKMDVPTHPENVGWYQFGAVPGDIGSAVLAGHVNWKNSPGAVFMDLKKITIGDTLTITNSNQEIISFLVHDIKKYPLDANTMEVFSSHDGLSHVNLITCGGLWNSLIGSHELRLVIFTTKIS